MTSLSTSLAYVFGGENLTRWDSARDKIDVSAIKPNSVDEAIKEIVQKAKEANGKKLTVVISWAGSKGPDGETFSMNNFPIRQNKRAQGNFNFKAELKQELEKAGLKEDAVNLRINNDGDLSLEDSALVSNVKKGSRALGILLGSGMSLSDGINYQGDAKFEKIASADSPQMPDLEKYKAVEGETRRYSENDEPGTAASYITGGHPGESKLGAKATAKHLLELGKSGSNAEIKAALKELYRGEGVLKRFWNTISFAGMRRKGMLKKSELSKMLETGETITNDKLFQAAQNGDKLSLQILNFTALRVVDFLKSYIDQTEAKGNKTKIDNLFLYGKFANNLLNNDSGKMKFIRKNFEKALKKVSKAKITITNPQMDGARDLAQRLSKLQ